jgi:CheY-like chemotaxis protein
MDGFEALTALKADARTANVPVVMYTSKEGVLYIDQARARGAIGVLQKPPNPAHLDRILAELRLPTPPVSPSARPAVSPVPPTGPTVATGAPTVPDTTAPIAEVGAPTPAPVPLPVLTRPTGPWWLWPLAVLCAGFALVAWLSLDNYQDVQTLRAPATRVATERTVATTAPVAASETPRAGDSTRVLLDALSWALSRQARYDYGEIPLGDERLEIMRELLTRLSAAGFKGTVRIETHVGEFCLARDGHGGHRLPAPGTPFAECDIVEYTPAEAVALGQKQSDAFARYLGERSATRTAPEIVIVSHGVSRPMQRYPEPGSVRTAGDWNSIARLNQRVEITLVSGTP